MKNFFLLLIFTFSVILSNSQTQSIQKIWQVYEQANEIRNKNSNSDFYIVEQNHTLPEVGTQKVFYKIYFKTLLNDNIDKPFEQKINIVEKKYNQSKNNYSEEYLFDENNNLLYFFRKENYGQYREFRFYFNGEHVEKLTITYFDAETGKQIQKVENYTSQQANNLFIKEIEYSKNEKSKIFNIFNALKIY